MKPLNEVLQSICSTLECEYVEVEDDKILSSPTEECINVTKVWICYIKKGDSIIANGFASPISNEGITETTKETAREWLLLSLITKAINQ